MIVWLDEKMKVVHREINKGGEGKIGLIPEDPDDLWFIYNLIQKGDLIQASTFRKVISESSTGSTGSSRIKLTLTISSEKLEYDSEANVVKIKGKNVEENKYVKRGQYHTIYLDLNTRFFLIKPIWDALALSQLNNACNSSRNAEVAVVIMQEGLAFVCLLTTHMSVQKAKIEVNIPRKRRNFTSNHEKGLGNFYEQILQAILRFVNFESIKCLIIASPGFTKDQFFEYMWDQASKRELKQLTENKQKFLVTHSSTGFKHSIKEILSNPEIQAKLEDTKAVQEVKIWNKFQEMLYSAPNQAIYGLKEIAIANECQAISHLMISDSMFRSNDLLVRKQISRLIHEVKFYGDVKILSSMHLTGQQLNQLTGAAAILKFEVPKLVELQQSEMYDFNSSSSDTSSISSNEPN